MKKPILRLRKIQITPKVYLKFPDSPGVYIFYKKSTPIYVGKAVNLKKRVASYFRLNLEVKTGKMISEAEEISYVKVESELESLLLEAKLIKLFQPKYNIAAKDDKHPLYIQITKEELPRIVTARRVDLGKTKSLGVYGPFPSSNNVRMVLKMLRKIFPYSDHKLGKKSCLYSQIGLCDPCINTISNIEDQKLKRELKTKYKRNIKRIKAVLDGKIGRVKKELESEMKKFSIEENYEEAVLTRNKIQRLEYITNKNSLPDSYLENPNLLEDLREKEILDLKRILKQNKLEIDSLKRIECFDVAHLQGVSAAASMVTFINGEPDKKCYRHFRIYQKKGQDDYASMREIASRRKKHLTDWGKPNLIIVDGGKGQLSVFMHSFKDEDIPIIGLAKRLETLVIPVDYLGAKTTKEYRLPKGPALNLVQRLRNEAHRFAQAYHKKLLTKSLISP